MKFLHFYPTISDYFWSDFCYGKQLKFSIIPRFRVHLEHSEHIFILKLNIPVKSYKRMKFYTKLHPEISPTKMQFFSWNQKGRV
jgi:hypothetical protein